MTKEKFESVKSAIENFSEGDIINMWNRFCEDHRMDDDEVEYMDSFDELWSGESPTWIAERVFYGDFNPHDEYYRLNGYGNFVSFNYWDDSDSPICIDEEFVEWVVNEFDEVSDYVTEDDIAEDFVDYINSELNTDYSIQEIYDLADKADEIENPEGEVYDLDTILNDDWDMWLANVKVGISQPSEAE